jgi:hypothetical protein
MDPMPRSEPVEKIGFDLHTRQSQLAILTEDGEIVELRIATTREAFTRTLGERPRARILLEVGTESEWVAASLEGLGHEVVVADPNFAPKYATLSRKIKTDRRDALALLDATRVAGASRSRPSRTRAPSGASATESRSGARTGRRSVLPGHRSTTGRPSGAFGASAAAAPRPSTMCVSPAASCPPATPGRSDVSDVCGVFGGPPGSSAATLAGD